ncbi:MAG: chemotaxis protein CheB [Marinobacter sp.]
MTAESGRPAVAIVSDDVLQRHRLQEATGRFGLRPGFSGPPERILSYEVLPDADLWLVTLEDEADHPVLFDHLLDHTDAPILFGIDPAPRPGTRDFVRWERRLLKKLEQQLGPLEQTESREALEELADRAPERPAGTGALPPWIRPATPGQLAEEVWILGASLGGPAAVKTFLDHLPPGLPVGFVYAQHIDGNFTDVLARVLGRHAHYRLQKAEEGMRITCGRVTVMPVEREWALTPEGALTEKDSPWPGPYGPSIDQVLLNFGDHFQGRCHAILFSGMGNDGAVSAPMLRAFGSNIWVQNSETCANSAMPEAVAATGCAGFCGSPAELARALVRTLADAALLKQTSSQDVT